MIQVPQSQVDPRLEAARERLAPTAATDGSMRALGAAALAAASALLLAGAVIMGPGFEDPAATHAVR